MKKGDALLVVDVQRDFCEGGALAVPGGDEVVPVMNQYIERFRAEGLPVYATRDWHPPKTQHFQEWGGPWPVHCVQGTRGAEFHPELRLPGDARIVDTGTTFEDHGYSAFGGTVRDGMSISEALRSEGVGRLFVGGLATDYCVLASVLDARKDGFDVVLLTDAVRGIEAEPGDVERAVREMTGAGARTATLETLDQL